MFSMLALVAIILLIVLLSKNSSGGSTQSDAHEINQQWMDYIEGYKKLVKKPIETALLNNMLNELRSQGMPAPRNVEATVAYEGLDTAEANRETVAAQTTSQALQSSGVVERNSLQTFDQGSDPISKPPDIDSETLLLYFGAFLFVAAAGLFVGFGTANGGVRLSVVLAVMALMYGGGMWLYDNRPKLKVAGLTFIGIGLMLAPLAGVAAYSFLFRDSPQVVWFATSLLSLGLYGHALRKLKNPLLEYIFLGTFLSLFESSVSILQAPAYYYGWMLAAFGLVLQAMAMWRGWSLSSKQPTSVTSQLLLPAAFVVALLLTPEYGFVQLGVSALLTGTYYLLAAIRFQNIERDNYAIASHTVYLVAAGCFAYAVSGNLTHVSTALLAASFVQLLVYVAVRTTTTITYNAATILLASIILAIVFAWNDSILMLWSTLWLAGASAVLWIRQERSDAYVVAAWALAAAPIIYAQLVSDPVLGTKPLAWLVTATLFAQLAAMYAARRKTVAMTWWQSNMRVAYLTVLAAAVLFALLSGGWTALIICALIALSTLPLAHHDDMDVWSLVGGLVIFAPLLVIWSNPALFLTATVTGLLWNIALAIRYRLEVNRWLGTILWLLLPLAIAHQWSDQLWNATYYATSYTVAVIGLLLARAIATGRVMQSSNVPIVSYMQTASVSYVTGYLVAGTIAMTASLTGPRFLPVFIALTLACVAYFASIKIERKVDGLSAIPLLLQVGLWGSYQSTTEATTYILLSSILAVAGYAWAREWKDGQGLLNRRAMAQMSVILAYVAPFTMFFFEPSWAMPLGLGIAGLMTLDASWREPQSSREMAGGVIVVAVLWWMNYLGVENIQAYTHVIAAAFGLYAYWRATRGESEQSQQYIVLMLVSATVPLALQAMAGAGGGTYGWWFLLEQIGIMLLGLSMNNSFVTRWGLYAAVLAVLYQLRNLGWAALTVLAIFIIGMALYRLQRKGDAEQVPETSEQDK